MTRVAVGWVVGGGDARRRDGMREGCGGGGGGFGSFEEMANAEIVDDFFRRVVVVVVVVVVGVVGGVHDGSPRRSGHQGQDEISFQMVAGTALRHGRGNFHGRNIGHFPFFGGVGFCRRRRRNVSVGGIPSHDFHISISIPILLRFVVFSTPPDIVQIPLHEPQSRLHQRLGRRLVTDGNGIGEDETTIAVGRGSSEAQEDAVDGSRGGSVTGGVEGHFGLGEGGEGVGGRVVLFVGVRHGGLCLLGLSQIVLFIICCMDV
mmetsp:Transcript_634/g.1268  ORF Transcript_634/g.1268 Transcript_634/m.1268 type:complete len:261 (+) Transcript_634:568-1350(+)